jgi:hypothetical protein
VEEEIDSASDEAPRRSLSALPLTLATVGIGRLFLVERRRVAEYGKGGGVSEKRYR